MRDTPDILKRILLQKSSEVKDRKANIGIEELKARVKDSSSTRGFHMAIERKISTGQAAVIAEIKKASPSKGVIRENFDPAKIARNYADHGACCLSVLTDEEFFQGKDEYLIAARDACDLPVLRKDFLIDPYQIYESRVIGSDCILLIVAALDDRSLAEMADLATQLGMDVLIEVHDREELERALVLRLPLIGINNRDLHTFETDLNTTLGLLTDVFPDRTVITESGIHSRDDVATMRKNNVNAFLVGEALMSEPDPGLQLEILFDLKE